MARRASDSPASRVARLVERVLARPSVLLNIAVALLGAGWLMAIGGWGIVLFGAVAMLIFGAIGNNVLIPQVALGMPATWCLQAGYRVGFLIFSTLSRTYLYLLMTAWAAAVLWVVLKQMVGDGAAPSVLLPSLLWSYAVAATPCSVIALQERASGEDGIGRVATAAFHLGYAAMLPMVLLGLPFTAAVIGFGAVMVLTLAVDLYTLRVAVNSPPDP
jgi:hypothetical protein